MLLSEVSRVSHWLQSFLRTRIHMVSATGTNELCKPIRRCRLLLPIIVAALMMAILVGAACMALGELFHLIGVDWAFYAFWGVIFVNWIAWALFFYFDCQGFSRFRVLKRLTLIVLAGSVASMLVSKLSQIIVTRRPGLFAGLDCGVGLIAGLCVMLWSFGPGIILFFLRERYEQELKEPKKIEE